MRKLLATAAVLSIISAAAPATAATYASTVIYDGGWKVSWNVVQPSCRHTDFPSTVINSSVFVGGIEHQVNSVTINTGDPTVTYIIFSGAIPNGQLTSIKHNGESFIECGGDTYLLPGYVAPAPAAIPTLSEWAMILLGVALAGAAALTIHRRRTA